MHKMIILLLFVITGCGQNEHREKDWAYMKRYAGENVKLPLPDSNERRVVFMGNSITEQWSVVYPGFFKDKPYINRGISSQTTSQMLVRFRQDVIDLHPSVVVILAGTNDIAENTGPIPVEKIAANIFSMAELAKANKIEPVLCSVLPVKFYYWKKSIDPVPQIAKLNELIRDYCAANNIVYIDYYSSLVNKESGLDWKYTKDGVHPNAEGYKVMSSLTDTAIRSVLTK